MFNRTPSPGRVSPFPSLKKNPFDMSEEEQAVWEDKELGKVIDFNEYTIDPAPFQLVEKTSIFKVHSLFSMIGVNIAYVTSIGKLMGVVSLKELRSAIQDANAGHLEVG